MLPADVMRHRSEFARALRNRHFEVSPAGILFPQQKVFIGGVFETRVNGRDPDLSPNIFPTEGLNHVLDIVFGGGAQQTSWYIAPFSGNVTPGASLTAATFVAVCTEFTGYSEATREAFVEAAAAGGVMDNDATRAEFSITAASATLYGAALLSVGTKSSGSGVCAAASRFAASRAVVTGDTLQVKYTLTGTSS